MPSYTWSCFACGFTNAPQAGACEQCGCPAVATVREIEEFRGAFQQTGGSVGESAALLPESSDKVGLELLVGVPSLLLFGLWPFSRSRGAK